MIRDTIGTVVLLGALVALSVAATVAGPRVSGAVLGWLLSPLAPMARGCRPMAGR